LSYPILYGEPYPIPLGRSDFPDDVPISGAPPPHKWIGAHTFGTTSTTFLICEINITEGYNEGIIEIGCGRTL